MPNLRELRFKLRISAAILGLLCLALAGLLVFFASSAARQADTFQGLHSQIQNSKTAMVPPQIVEERVKECADLGAAHVSALLRGAGASTVAPRRC